MIEILNRWTKAVVYRSEKSDLIGTAAKEAILTGADLTGADLTGADLTGVDLAGADLTEADLTGADLTGADLTGADLTEADLTGAVLTDAVLRRADLSNSNCGTALGDFLRITGTRHPICAIDEGNVSIGCMRNSLAWWREHYSAVGRNERYSAEQIEEYRLHIEYVATWMSVRKQAVQS